MYYVTNFQHKIFFEKLLIGHLSFRKLPGRGLEILYAIATFLDVVSQNVEDVVIVLPGPHLSSSTGRRSPVSHQAFLSHALAPLYVQTRVFIYTACVVSLQQTPTSARTNQQEKSPRRGQSRINKDIKRE